MYKTILFTHNDLDGAGCRIIFELAFAYVPNDKWEVVICSNNNVNDKVTEHISGRTSHYHVCGYLLFTGNLETPQRYVW